MTGQTTVDEALASYRAEVGRLTAERDRYRDALERIKNHGETHAEPCWALHCADTMQEIARAALDQPALEQQQLGKDD